MSRAGKIAFGVICFGLGVAFAIGTADGLLHPGPPDDFAPWLLGMFAAMLLLGSFLLLRPSNLDQAVNLLPPQRPHDILGIADFMRWGMRGFFWFWLVLLAVWIGVFVYSVGPKSYWQSPILKIETPTGHVLELDLSKSQAEVANAITLELQREVGRQRSLSDTELEKLALLERTTPELIPKYRDQILTWINSEYRTRGEQAKNYWLLTLIPPLALLAFVCTAWILLPPRRDSKDSKD